MLNKRQRSKFHREGVSHQPAPAIDTQKKDTIGGSTSVWSNEKESDPINDLES
jgi:hypothetical protein